VDDVEFYASNTNRNANCLGLCRLTVFRWNVFFEMTAVAQSSVAQKIIRPNVFRPTGFSPNRLHPVESVLRPISVTATLEMKAGHEEEYV